MKIPARARCVGVEFQHVVAVQVDLPRRHFVVGVAHDGQAERALAGTVRPHQGVRLAPC